MMNMDIITLNNTITREKTTAQKNEMKSSKNTDFKSVIEKVATTKDDTKVKSNYKNTDNTKEKINKDTKETKNNNEIVDKVNDIVGKIENDEDISSEVMELLSILGLNVANDFKIPVELTTEISTFEEISDNLNIDLDNINLSSQLNITEDVVGNNDINNELGNLFTKLIDEVVAAEEYGDINSNTEKVKSIVDKLVSEIENVVAAVNTEAEEPVLVENIVTALKEMLNNKEVSTRENTISDTNINNVVVEEVVDNSSDNDTNFNQEDTSKKVVSEEESILIKFTSDEGNGFSKALNNVQLRGQISQPTVNEPVTVYKSNMENDIIKNVKFMVRASVQELKVKIYPKEMGEMTIKILSEEGIMKAEIKATSKETYNLLNSNINEIKKVLSNENIKIEDVELSLYEQDTTYFSGENSKQGNEDNNHSGVTKGNVINNRLTEDEIIEADEEETNVDLLV